MKPPYRWAQATTLIQVAIALSAIALLTRKKWLQWGVLAMGGGSIAIAAMALLESLHLAMAGPHPRLLLPWQLTASLRVSSMVKMIKFVVIGGLATALQFLFLGLFVELLHIEPTLASATAYGSAAIFNYLANYHFTFSSTASHSKTLPKFAVTVAIGVSLNTALFAVFLPTLEQHLLPNTPIFQYAYLLSQLFATLVTLVVNFLMHKFWIYRGCNHSAK